LAIEVVDAVTNTEERILCAGSSLNLLAQTITAPGTYSAKYTGSNGCDSTQTFIVIESEPNNVFETRVFTKLVLLVQMVVILFIH